jgi:acyl carrier protein
MLEGESRMNAEQIISKIDQIFVDEFELAPDLVVPESNLRDDLDLDSLDGVDLMVALEKQFGFRVDEKILLEMQTVGDIHDYVRNHLGEINAGTATAPKSDSARP